MAFDAHINRLKKVLEELQAAQVEHSLLSNLDLIGLLKLRLAKGQNAQGGRFTDYSDIYAKERREAGLQTQFKDFNVSGRLYASIQPEVISESNNRIETAITAKGQDNQLKIRGARHYRGDEVLEISADEIATVTRLHAGRINDKLNQLLNG